MSHKPVNLTDWVNIIILISKYYYIITIVTSVHQRCHGERRETRDQFPMRLNNGKTGVLNAENQRVVFCSFQKVCDRARTDTSKEPTHRTKEISLPHQALFTLHLPLANTPYGVINLSSPCCVIFPPRHSIYSHKCNGCNDMN